MRPLQAEEDAAKNAEDETRKQREMRRQIEKVRAEEDRKECEEKAARAQRKAEAEARWKQEAEAAAEERATAEAAVRKKMEKEAPREEERKKLDPQRAEEDRDQTAVEDWVPRVQDWVPRVAAQGLAQKKAEEEKKREEAAARKNAEAEEERPGVFSHRGRLSQGWSLTEVVSQRVSRMRQRDFEMERLMEETFRIREDMSIREDIRVAETERVLSRANNCLLSRAKGMEKKRMKEDAAELEHAREEEERARVESEERNQRHLQADERMRVLHAIHLQQEQAQERLRRLRLGNKIVEEEAAAKHQEKTNAAERMGLEEAGFQKMKKMEAQFAEEEARMKDNESAAAKQKAEKEAKRKEEKEPGARDTGKQQRESSRRALLQLPVLQHSLSQTNVMERWSGQRARTTEEAVVLKLVSNNIMFSATNLATALGPQRLFELLPGGQARVGNTVGNTVTPAQKQVDFYNVCEGTLISPCSTPHTSAYSTPPSSVFPTLSAPPAMLCMESSKGHRLGLVTDTTLHEAANQMKRRASVIKERERECPRAQESFLSLSPPPTSSSSCGGIATLGCRALPAQGGKGRWEPTTDLACAAVEEESDDESLDDESFHTAPDTPAFSRLGSQGHQEDIELFVL